MKSFLGIIAVALLAVSAQAQTSEDRLFGIASWEPTVCRELTTALHGTTTAGEIGRRLGQVLKSPPFTVVLEPGSDGVRFNSTVAPSRFIRIYQ